MGKELNAHGAADDSAHTRLPLKTQPWLPARARSRAYALLARLAGSGPQSTREMKAATADAGMARAIASYGGDLDALAADHQHVFGFACPPFESALLDPAGHLGNAMSERVHRDLAAIGVAEGPGGEGPDHLAAQLYALALLTGAEADALEDAENAIAERLRGQARQLLDAHLLRWLPTLAAAVRRGGRAWPIAVMHTIEEVVLEHRSTLGALDEAQLGFELPPLGVSLEEDETGLADIARLLGCPARAGVLLSRDDLARLGRMTGTPRGFGDRATLIENLLRAGAQLGSLESILDALGVLLDQVQRELGDERLADVPLSLRMPWQVRIDETRALLATVREVSRDAS